MGFHDISKELADVAGHYHFHRPPAFIDSFRDWLGWLLRQIHDWWTMLFSHSGSALDSRAFSSILQFLVYVVAAVAITGGIYILTRRLRHAQQQKEQTVRGASSIEEILDADGWRNQAKKLAAQSDYRGACRAVYLCLLQGLDESGVAKFAPTKTNYEYAYSLNKHPQLQLGFRKLSDLVETIWFGNRTAQEADFRESAAELAKLESELLELKRRADAVERV